MQGNVFTCCWVNVCCVSSAQKHIQNSNFIMRKFMSSNRGGSGEVLTEKSSQFMIQTFSSKSLDVRRCLNSQVMQNRKLHSQISWVRYLHEQEEYKISTRGKVKMIHIRGIQSVMGLLHKLRPDFMFENENIRSQGYNW